MDLVGAAAPLAAEAVRAIDGLAARRAEGDLSLLAAVRARGAEHLARPAVATVAAAATATAAVAAAGPAAAIRVARGLAAGATRRTAPRLGEPTLCVEVLLTGGEHELLAAVGAGQVLVVVHETKTPLGSRAIPPGFLASAVRGVRVVVELRLFLP